MGSPCVKHGGKTQTTFSLSCGESELHSIAAGVAQTIGFQSNCHDLGFEHKIRVHSDATAAIGIARRRGMRKIRHLDCTDLWVQEKKRSGAMDLVKIPGVDNPVDAFTKHVGNGILTQSMQKMCMMALEGRARSGPDNLGLLPEVFRF